MKHSFFQMLNHSQELLEQEFIRKPFADEFNIAYWHRKYHSGTICKGVSNPQTSKALSGCEKEEIPK